MLLKSSQETIKKQTERIQFLENENRRLSVRGAFSYHELTPRHSSLKDKFSQFKLKEPQAVNDEKGQKYISSVAYIDELFSELLTRKKRIKQLIKQIEDFKSADKDSNIP